MSAVDSTLISRARTIAERVARSEGLEVVDVEWRGSAGRGVLRVYIDRPEGVTHGDCEVVSKQLSTILDVEDFIPGSYNLEVSSPGLDRKLSKLEDYHRFAGRKARIKLRQPVDGKQQLTGRLQALEGEVIVVEAGPQTLLRIPFADVDSARLVVEF